MCAASTTGRTTSIDLCEDQFKFMRLAKGTKFMVAGTKIFSTNLNLKRREVSFQLVFETFCGDLGLASDGAQT